MTERGGSADTERTHDAMGRRKVSMGLVPNRGRRTAMFRTQKEGMKKKARELSVLCGVEVALVVAPADGDGAPGPGAAADVWEYLAYLDAELGKEEAKLARVRQAGPEGLDHWDGVANAEDARRLLDALDAAIRAADDRRRALGLPEDGGEDAGAGMAAASRGLGRRRGEGGGVEGIGAASRGRRRRRGDWGGVEGMAAVSRGWWWR